MDNDPIRMMYRNVLKLGREVKSCIKVSPNKYIVNVSFLIPLSPLSSISYDTFPIILEHE